MTPEQIREAVKGLSGSQLVGERMRIVIDAALAYADVLERREYRVVDWRGWNELRYASAVVAEEGRVRADTEEPDYAPHRVEVRVVGEWKPVEGETP